MELYVATFFGLWPESGEEAFKRVKYFSNKAKALDQLRKWTNEDMEQYHEDGLRDALGAKDLFCHLIHYKEREGVYEVDGSHVYSLLMADGESKNFEGESVILESL